MGVYECWQLPVLQLQKQAEQSGVPHLQHSFQHHSHSIRIQIKTYQASKARLSNNGSAEVEYISEAALLMDLILLSSYL